MQRVVAILITVFVSVMAVQAQNGYNDPFSQYGFSQSSLPTGTPIAASWGGVVYSRSGSNFVNPFNPASYASIQSESFVFDISMTLKNSRLTSGNNGSSAWDGSLCNLAIAFPLFSWWKTSIGLLPYSNTNYETTLLQPIAGLSQQVKTIYDGSGGIAQFYWGNGFNVLGNMTDYSKPVVQAGFNLNYLRGSVSQAVSYDFLGSDTSFFQDTRRQRESTLADVAFDAGALYRQPLGEDYSLTLGLSAKLPRKMTLDEDAMKYTYVTSSAKEYIVDTIFPGKGQSGKYESTLRQPLNIGLGLQIERNQLWTVAVDFSYAKHSGMKYEENADNAIVWQNGLRYDQNMRFAIGGGWLGDAGATRYVGRMGFTGGLHYEKARLCLALASGQWTLDEWGAGLGVTFPMRKGRSQLVLTAAYSNLGTTDLLRSEVWSFGITLSSNERWFVKRKYN